MDKLGLLRSILDTIEERESRLLAWGDTDGVFSRTELENLIFDLVSRSSTEIDPDVNLEEDELIGELLDHAMIVEVDVENDINEDSYRSRMAQSVFLYKYLRQWHGQPIEQSKPLVSDFRFQRLVRRYPKRPSRNSDLLITQWLELGLLSGQKSQILRALIGDLFLAGFQERATESILRNVQSKQKKHPTATIVCAGTGSGKTNAFYWPALTQIGDDIIIDSSAKVRALAVYPRNELLKDQFNQTHAQARTLDKFLQSNYK